jgi:hypothetical protein
LNQQEQKLHRETVSLRSMRSPRKDAYGLIMFSVLFLGCLALDEQRMGFGSVAIVGFTVLLGLLLVLGVLNLLPEKFWQYGVEMKEDGFVFHDRLRKAKFIRYCAIDRIIVISFYDGGGEATCTTRVESTDGNARLDERLLYDTGMLDALKCLPGFRQDAWAKSDATDDSSVWELIGKKTVVLNLRAF